MVCQELPEKKIVTKPFNNNATNNDTNQAFNALNYLGKATLERGASIGPEGAGVLVRDVGVAHVLGAVVGVAAATVPVALDRLGLKRHVEAMVLSNTDQQVSSHPQLIACLNALAWANLELPLSREHFAVDSSQLNTSVLQCKKKDQFTIRLLEGR
jgi:hypothetical protein